jgi:arylsulfatase A-like enzyme
MHTHNIDKLASEGRIFTNHYVHSAVHDPFDEPKKWLESASHIEPDRRQYAACVQHMDATIGRMIEGLDKTGQRENTMVILFSDNGGSNGEGSPKYPEGIANSPIKGLNHPLRGWKKEVYEGGIRVPAFVNWPKVLKTAIVNTPVHVTDWMPTICSLLDIPEIENTKWDGMNIWPLLIGEDNTTLENRELYWQGMKNKSAALRQGNLKLVVQRHNRGNEIELFDLSVDPFEKNDLSVKHPEIVTKMLKALSNQEMLDNDAVPTDEN